MVENKQGNPFERLLSEIPESLVNNSSFREDLQSCATVLNVRKGEVLLHTGELCSSVYFINKGLLVNMFVTEKGNECVTSFASDIQYPFLSDISYVTHKSSGFEIRALEESELVRLSKAHIESLSQKYPDFMVYYIHVLQLLIAKHQTLFAILQSYTAEEFIQYIYSCHPWIIHRVPDKYIAHYMRISTSWFCKLKKRVVKR